MEERQKHRDAFERFLAHGAVTSDEAVREVAVECQVSERTFWRWYNAFNWKRRAEQRQIEIGKKVEEKNNDTIADQKAEISKEIAEYKAILRRSMANAVKRNDEGKQYIAIEPKNARDLREIATAWEKFSKLALVIMGEASERIEGDIRVILPDDIDEDDLV